MKYDVAVIGAGPAGSFAAKKLASRGYNTVLIDPCDNKKVCAGILTAQYVREYEVNDDHIERKLKGVRISFKDVSAEINYRQAVEYSIDRQAFDNFNLNEALAANSKLKKDTVVSVLENDHCIEIKTKYDVLFSDYAVLSSGVSDLASQFGGPRAYAYCVQQRIDTTPGDYFEMDLKKDGYSWIAPKSDHILTGTSSMIDYPDIPGDKALIPVGGPVQRTFYNRLLLAGDAGGFVSPFEGEGIYYARRSGEIASEILAGVMSGENGMEDYERRWKKEFDFSTLNVVSDLLADEYVLEKFVKEIRDNEKFRLSVENVLTKESKDLSPGDISYFL
jgi:geranylgeranyl reductase